MKYQIHSIAIEIEVNSVLIAFFCILRPETEQTATLKRSAMKKYLKRECEMEDG